MHLNKSTSGVDETVLYNKMKLDFTIIYLSACLLIHNHSPYPQSTRIPQ